MKNSSKSRLKRQLLSTGIYIALSAAVVGVTTSTVAKLISDNTQNIQGDLENTKYSTGLSELPEIPALPEINSYTIPELTDIPNTAVSGSHDGVNAEIVPGDVMYTPTAKEQNTEETQETSVPKENVPDFGYEGYVKPCSGFISHEFSDSVPVYSPTMYDYRVHTGIDIASDVTTPVKAVSGGTVTDVNYDDMLGMTITIDSPGGLSLKYCNLSEEIVSGIQKDAIVKTGDVIGCIGQTALVESAQAPHLHLEAYRDGIVFNPEELFEEANAIEARDALKSTQID